MSRPPVEDGGVLIGEYWWRFGEDGPCVWHFSQDMFRPPGRGDWWWVKPGHEHIHALAQLGLEVVRCQDDATAEVGGDWWNLRPGDQIEVHDSHGPRLCVVTSSIFVDFEMSEKLVDLGEGLSVVDEDGHPGLIDASTSVRLVWRPMYQTKGNNDD